MEAAIQVIESTLAARDPYTAGHQQRVTQIAGEIAAEMNLAPDRLEALRVAARLHDLGKIAVPLALLSKPGKVTELEFAMIRTHPQVAHDILLPLQLPDLAYQIILQHHERLDGSGYPQGLKEGEILLEARILAVADVLEAMSSHRPYRAALGLTKALEELADKQGILYDSSVVAACLRVYGEEGAVRSQEAASEPVTFRVAKRADAGYQKLQVVPGNRRRGLPSIRSGRSRVIWYSLSTSLLAGILILAIPGI